MTREEEVITGETCPICHQKTLTLTETSLEVPYFGKLYIFGMNCSNCQYRKADLEADEEKPPVKYVLDIENSEDLNARVIKSSQAVVKLGRIGSITPGPASEGYVTNVQGIVERIKRQVEAMKNMEDDPALKKKAKNVLKKIAKILQGSLAVKLTIEDPSGNSAIISEKAVKSALK
ncbi:ZPR1 zinc finger domain-containing protein [Candidatus Woesearchaeota archaeon]|nr:ZPR1 zinc finger domain-containing protein [Candidatus Woesearchaeota archaeon]